MTEEAIFVPYNYGLAPLEALLAGVQRPGDFCTHSVLEVPLPRIEVDGIGVLSFPVPQAQVRQLIEQATRAPYGRGEETLLDESVRKAWQLPPDKVRIGGKSWDASFQRILDQVAAGLGCAEVEVSAELYKVLIYETGGFFTAHRDTEKTDGMFATLVVILPTEHRGGELIVRHAGREVTVNMAGAEFSELAFAAFYADCEHEVRPITAGHRVCLTYNLIQSRPEQRNRTLTAPLYDAEGEAAARLLAEAFAAGTPIKLAWLLEHQYSAAELSFAKLKNADAARAEVILAAAERAGCAAHLGIVHIEETGSAEPNYAAASHRYGGSRGRSYGGFNVDSADASSEDYEVIEVCDRAQYIDRWVSAEDRPVAFGSLPVEEDEVLPAGALDNESPDEQRLMEATGNEGVSFERSYHRAALVIWPRERFVNVLLQAGVGAALPYFKDLVCACHGAGAERRTAAAVAEQIVAAWEQAPPYRSYRNPGSLAPEASRAEMIHLLGTFGDPTLLSRFIGGVVIRYFDGSENEALAAHASSVGAAQAGELLARLARENMRLFPGGCVNVLARSIREPGTGLTAQWRTALREMAAAIVGSLPAPAGAGAEGHDGGSLAHSGLDGVEWWRAQKSKPVDAVLVAELLDSLQVLEAVELRTEAAAALIANVCAFDPGTIIVSALAALRRQTPDAFAVDGDAERLWIHAAGFLLARNEVPPPPPTDWRQSVKLSCQCEDCRALAQFSADPVQQFVRFRMPQSRRSHLEAQIRSHRLDMCCATERKGSPHTLVCMKTREVYRRQCEQHRVDCAAMSVLLELFDAAPERLAAWIARLKAARARQPCPNKSTSGAEAAPNEFGHSERPQHG